MSASPAVHRRPSPSVLCVVVVFSASSGSRYETVETDLFVPSSLLVVKTVLWGARKNRPPSVSSATNGHFRRALIDALMCALMSGTPCVNQVSFWHSHFFLYSSSLFKHQRVKWCNARSSVSFFSSSFERNCSLLRIILARTLSATLSYSSARLSATLQTSLPCTKSSKIPSPTIRRWSAAKFLQAAHITRAVVSIAFIK